VLLLLLLLQGSLPVAAGGCLQLAAADISQRQTLSAEMFDGVKSVVSCTAVKVQPKEGDTVDRQKYYQVRRYCCMSQHVIILLQCGLVGGEVCGELHRSEGAA
jgi:hypothetical protein